MRKFFLALALLLGCTSLASAQQGSLVQQSGTLLDACTATAVGTNFNTVNTQSTATITVPAGQYAYICRIELEAMQDATGTALTNAAFTSTGLGSGAAASPQWSVSCPLTVNANCFQHDIVFPHALKSNAAGTNVTVVSPSAATHTGFGIKIYYYLGT